jgi:hypothetical protein
MGTAKSVTPSTLGRRPVRIVMCEVLVIERREGLSESDSIGGEHVQGWGFHLLASVATDVIGAQRVDGDEVDVGEWISRG